VVAGALAACANAPKDHSGHSPAQQVHADARVGDGEGGFGGGGSDPDDGGLPRDFGGFDDDGGTPPPPHDAAAPRQDAAEMPPDPDMGVPRPARLRAGILLTDTPQAHTSTATVGINEPFELPVQAGCQVFPVNVNSPAPAAPRGYDGGEITISGVNGGEIRFHPQADATGSVTYQAEGQVPNNLFGNGATLRATGAGGSQFAAFDVQVAAPQSVQIQSPGQPSPFPDSQDSGDNLDVSWVPAQSDVLLLTLIPTEPLSADPISGNWAVCKVDDTGHFSVPSNILGPIADGAGFGGRGCLVVLTRTRQTVAPVGGDDVVLSVSVSQGTEVTLQ
jgi:hypothetical protein